MTEQTNLQKISAAKKQAASMDRIDKFLSAPVKKSVAKAEAPAPSRVKKRVFSDDAMTGVASAGAPKAKTASTVKKAEVKVEQASDVKVKAGSVKVVFLGGIGEIGKNITAIEYGNDIVLIDCGLAFPSEDMPGIDLVIPDFTYLKNNADKIRGICITHGHEDHIGSLPYLLRDIKVPVYGSNLALALLDNKLREHKITGVPMGIVRGRQVIKLGCMSVEFVIVNHSIPGAFALSITTPVGVVFHTGDFKIDHEPIDGNMIDLPRIAEIGRKGVLLMMCESTNVEREGYTPSERSIGAKLDRVFMENADRRLFVATFASNIFRLQQIIELAIKYKRRVAVVGRSMINNIETGNKIGLFKFDKSVFIDIEKIHMLEDKNILVLSTGSQGEPTSAMSRLASGDFARVEIGDNDTVILSSSPIPGNENMVNRVINNLYRKGATVVHENVHASGHACMEEIKVMHALLKPKFFMPVHGEYRHLKEHCMLAEKLGMDKRNMLIPEIGMAVEVNKQHILARGVVPAGEMLVDGLGIGEVGSNVLKDRKLLSEDGLVIAVMAVSSETGAPTADPYLITRGFAYNGEVEELCEEAKGVLLDTLATIKINEFEDWNEVRNIIRKPLRNFFYRKTKRTPMILTVVFKV